jgi:hypothetical protein
MLPTRWLARSLPRLWEHRIVSGWTAPLCRRRTFNLRLLYQILLWLTRPSISGAELCDLDTQDDGGSDP